MPTCPDGSVQPSINVYGQRIYLPCKASPPPAPPPAALPEQPVVNTGEVTDRLADLYMQAFGKASEGSGSVAVVPVGPEQGGGSGGGISVGSVAILAALGLGGYFLYQKFAT